MSSGGTCAVECRLNSISEKFLALKPHEELPTGDFDYLRGVSSGEMDRLRIFGNRIFLKYVPKDQNVIFL